MRLLGGVRDITLDLLTLDLVRQERKRRRIRHRHCCGFEPRPVDGPAVQPRRRAGLQARPRETESAQLIAQQVRWRLAVAAATILLLADVRQAIQERAGRDNHRIGVNRSAIAQQHARNAPPV